MLIMFCNNLIFTLQCELFANDSADKDANDKEMTGWTFVQDDFCNAPVFINICDFMDCSLHVLCREYF